MALWITEGMGLTPAEEQLKCYLKRYAAGKGGKLRKNELKATFKNLGFHFRGLRAKRAIRHADVKGDGYIDDEETNELVKYAVKWACQTVKVT